ncbi:juvenile hormone esterase-like [Ochlerotatus camptorhynchus]|uniref:juvenile hormone esterase-like n=1 Tax=Ochlerotatus camptorhynchus TaxID=644619 RepID=UPI0031D6DBF3
MVELPSSYDMAERRMICLERKVRKHPELQASLEKQIAEFQTKGYANKATSQELEESDPHRTPRTTFGNISYCEYRGVRYGKSTAGEGRFQPPTLHEPNGREDYLRQGNVCPQLDDINYPSVVLGDEDCLFLNVYSPMVIDGGSYLHPVLVFIHGGSFTFGSGGYDVHGVDLLIENEIAVVSINYRLDVLGFLRYPRFNITGNYGLLDQLTALRWIHKNIQEFGGDPNRITLMGHSAGATSINYHMYSTHSKGLFQQAILSSGTFLMPHAYSYDPEKYADYYFGLLGISTREQLLNRSLGDFFILNDTTRLLGTVFASMQFPCFIPTADGTFITDAPHRLILEKPISNDIPLLVGTTSTEFELLLDYVKGYFSWDLNFPNRNNEALLSYIDTEIKVMAKHLKETGLVTEQSEFFRQLANYANMDFPVQNFIEQISERTAPIFRYRFEFDGKFGWYKNVLYRGRLNVSPPGVVHGDDLGYIFTPYNVQEALRHPEEYRSEWNVHRGMVRSISSFIKFGNPSWADSTWKSYNSDKSKNIVMAISNIFQSRKTNESNYLHNFWKGIHDCYYYYQCSSLQTINIEADNVN